MDNKIQIVTTPHERPKHETINNVPTTQEGFYDIVNNAQWDELKAYGFRKWDTMNGIIGDNIKYSDKPKMVSIPVFNANDPKKAAEIISGVIDGDIVRADGSMLMDLSSEEVEPMVLLEEDEDVILFPGEWYDIIPDGFKCTTISGSEVEFKKGKSGKDIRFGCIAYGIRRKVAKSITQ